MRKPSVKRIRWCFAGLLSLLGVSAALAWSSMDFFGVQPVHQIAIENVLSNQVPANLIVILQNEQAYVDTFQDATDSFKHSMTGLTFVGEPVTNVESQYISNAEQFVHAQLNAAIAARKAGNIELAYTNLGIALHPLEDATSPAHKPFQPWLGSKEGFYETMAHVEQEWSYPDDTNDPVQVEQRAELEGSVQYAYDIFIGSNSMPINFYNHTNGLLILPAAYLRKDVIK
ncbi:MAG TPA: hypothetical protein VNV43_09045 [Candidatus Acidoferrales bacterium]|jgi:hypothetical protein|nr:hypothetical protein [Candidatus Acidoferrales bacterium]